MFDFMAYGKGAKMSSGVVSTQLLFHFIYDEIEIFQHTNHLIRNFNLLSILKINGKQCQSEKTEGLQFGKETSGCGGREINNSGNDTSNSLSQDCGSKRRDVVGRKCRESEFVSQLALITRTTI